MRPTKPVQRRICETSPSLPGMHPLIDQIYRSRGVRSFNDVDLSLKNLLPVSSLDGIASAVQLLSQHHAGRVLVVGDFDADGATSSALVVRCLRAYGVREVSFLVPNRFEYGYGLSAELAIVALANDPTLIITVDNGISSVEGVALSREHGVDVLVTDHHLPPEELPNANVLLNPNMPGNTFASKNLAGVGVAFYLMAAYERHLVDSGSASAAGVAAGFLDLVALGTIADVVTLDRNNRILVQAGLQRIRAGKTVPGILALLAESGRDHMRLVASDLGFALGPRLNAAGRMEDMSVGIETLLTDAPDQARALAASLGAINKRRRETEADMQSAALQRVETLFQDSNPVASCICLYENDWHQGIVGLIASRIKERVHRPVFAFAKSDPGELKGSGRSIAGVHLRDLLAYVDAQNPHLIRAFGGHAMAAGLSLAADKLSEFDREIKSACHKLFPDADQQGYWLSDGELDGDSVGLEFAEQLRDAGPFGQGFDEPLFDGKFVLDSARLVGETHAKLRLRLANGRLLDAIAFGQGEFLPLAGGTPLKLVYRLDVNEFRGIRSAQFIVEQIEVLS